MHEQNPTPSSPNTLQVSCISQIVEDGDEGCKMNVCNLMLSSMVMC
jgi:hypothetical protein